MISILAPIIPGNPKANAIKLKLVMLTSFAENSRYCKSVTRIGSDNNISPIHVGIDIRIPNFKPQLIVAL